MLTVATTGGSGNRSVRATFPRSARILNPADFKGVFKENASSQDAFFRILARPSSSGTARLGMAVSKKVHKSAVVRNRIKRVIRESFRVWRTGQDSARAKPLDIVVLARPAAVKAENRQLTESLAVHWNRIEKAVDHKFTRKRA
jgi:ribonuclease P protein component